MQRPLHFITTFGLGYWRPASGTWGSLPPIMLALALQALRLGPATHPWLFTGVFAIVLIAFSAACIAQGDAAEARWGKDPSNAVADETAGQCIPLLFLPPAAFSTPALSLFTIGFAFFAFRLLDIAKPFPARQLQRLPAGWGILIDDLVAGLYALLVLQVSLRMSIG